jgi:hypothetical protein
VSIDGKSHGEMLLFAIGSGAIFAIIILVILISLIRHKKKVTSDEIVREQKTIVTPSGNFTLTTSSTDSKSSSPAMQKSNLMFKYFGKSLSSFDTQKSYTNADFVAINIELDNNKQFYRKQVLMPTEIISAKDLRQKYIQTISC